jgi:sugar phosphate isomerase/epimerase
MSSAPPYQFGISEFTTQPWSFEQDVERYARLGVEFIEVCEAKLDGDDARAAEQLAQIGKQGLKVSSIQPAIRTLFPSQSQPAPRDVPDRMARYRRTIERCQQVAAGVPFVTNTGNPPNGNMQQVLDTAAREYRALADCARDHGARVALEPLNAAIANVESAIWTLQQGMRIVEAVDRPNFGICLDVWNIWQNADIAAAITACGDRIYVVQVSDWRTPRSYQDRLIPGQGEIPLPPLLRAIHESGYRGPYVVEIFSGDVPDSLWEADLAQVIVESRSGLDHAWRAAFPAV